ncbi:hypothetical protein [Microbacterium sp. NPDC058345]|uniref:hypothetical protein n=1 Tax=Microbacterium sp. NPDC058345 TaxID=3346455 RepID=UPI00364FE912
MKRKQMLVVVPAMVAALSGCAPLLSSQEMRAQAVEQEAEQIRDALSNLDPEAIERLTCEHPWRVIEVQADPRPPAPLSVELRSIEPLSLQGSSYTDPDPDAEFFTASFTDTVHDEQEFARRVNLDAVVRVDERDACLWALDAPFVVYLGL